jgi:hypothetical protein
VPENVAVDKPLQIYGIQEQVSKPCSRRVQKAIHFSVDISHNLASATASGENAALMEKTD